MCANCFTAGDFRYSGPAACWRAPMPRRRTAGTAAPIPPLKKSPIETLGADLHRRSQLPARFDAARHLEPSGLPTRSSRNRGTQEREDSRRHRTLAHAVRLSPGYSLQCHYVPRLPRTTGSAIPPPRGDPDSGQRLLPQGRRGLGVVQVQPALAGSASVAALLAGIEPYRTAVAAHPQERDAQPFLRRLGRTPRHAHAGLRGDAGAPPTDPVLSDSFLLIVMSLYLCADV